jgi:drug/metabolite transporter (DMT)-like permease
MNVPAQTGRNAPGVDDQALPPGPAARGLGTGPATNRAQGWIWRQPGPAGGMRWIRQSTGAFLSPLFMGLAPFFAKMAYHAGAEPYTVIALRMVLAAGALWVAYLFFGRRYIRSWWLGIAMSSLAGVINGLGSICYYLGLTRVDASLASIINISYLVFVTLLLRIIGQAISRVTVVRLLLALVAVYLLSFTTGVQVDSQGVALLLLGALAYALQLVIGQRVLYDIPAPTMTLYSMSAMALVVTAASAAAGGPQLATLTGPGWHALLAFAGVTALSRLALFYGVKHMGSVQTATLGVSEVLVTVLFAMAFLGESLAGQQWAGAGLMVGSVLLLTAEKGVPRLIPFPVLPWAIKLSIAARRRRRR